MWVCRTKIFTSPVGRRCCAAQEIQGGAAALPYQKGKGLRPAPRCGKKLFCLLTAWFWCHRVSPIVVKQLKKWVFVLMFALAGYGQAADGGAAANYTGTAGDTNIVIQLRRPNAGRTHPARENNDDRHGS